MLIPTTATLIDTAIRQALEGGPITDNQLVRAVQSARPSTRRNQIIERVLRGIETEHLTREIVDNQILYRLA